MGNVGPWVFDEVLRGVEGATSEWQTVLGNNGHRDTIDLRIEAADTSGDALERAVLASLRERFPDFWKNLEMRLYDLRVTAVPRGTLRTSRKLRRIIDERQMAGAR
jgi:phenylacetate-coenzyme A ligase PaaK-like adenylate-forming protein